MLSMSGISLVDIGRLEFDAERDALSIHVNRRPKRTPDRHPIGTPSSYVSND